MAPGDRVGVSAVLGGAIGALVIGVAPAAFVEGPFPAMTGGFGEETCRSCHFDNPLNDPEGTLRIDGAPPSYTRGASYRITITLKRPGMERGGFQLSARFAEGPSAGRQAGELESTDDRVTVVDGPVGSEITPGVISRPGNDSRSDFTRDKLIRYAQHAPRGTRAAVSGELRWVIAWRAPADPAAAVVFHAAANAVNDDASALGDFIYLREAHSR